MKEIKFYLTNDEISELLYIMILAEAELENCGTRLNQTLTKFINILQKYQ